MPKVKVYPTPAQARALQALFDYEDQGLYLVYFGYTTGRSYAEWSSDGSYNMRWQVETAYGKPRASTVNKMIKEDWLTTRFVIVKEERIERTNQYVLSDYGKEIVKELTPEHFEGGTKGPNTLQILSALRKRHTLPEWIFVEELRLGTGWGGLHIQGSPKGMDFQQRIDAFALNCFPSKKFIRFAYEVKISRGDLKKELDNPDKRMGAMHISNYFYFATPVGLMKDQELPDQCGLIEVNELLEAKIIVKAPWREACDPYWPLIASIGRSLLKS